MFLENERPLTPEEVLVMGRELSPTLNQATVYRNLKILLEEEWLAKLHLPEVGTIYERNNMGHHHHFHCRACKKSFTIHTCPLDQNKPLVPEGFSVEDHEIFFYGTCPTCQ